MTTVLLLVLVLLAAAQLLVTIRRRVSVVAQEIDQAIERFGAAARHHAEVNAVLALTQNMATNPDLSANLLRYSREVVAATLLSHVNAIGNDINVVQEKLTAYRRNLTGGFTEYRKYVAEGEQMLQQLLAELEAANYAVERFAMTS